MFRLLCSICFFILTFVTQNQCLRVTTSFDTQKFNYSETFDEYIKDARELSKNFGFDPAPLSDTSVTLNSSSSSPNSSIRIDLTNGQLFGLSDLTVSELHVEMTTSTSASVKLSVPEIKSNYVCSVQNAQDVCKTVSTTLQNVEMEVSVTIDPLVTEDLIQLTAKFIEIGKTDVKIDDDVQAPKDDLKSQLQLAMPGAIQEGLSHTLKNAAGLINSLVPDFYKQILGFVLSRKNLAIVKTMSNFALQRTKELEKELVSSASFFINKFGF